MLLCKDFKSLFLYSQGFGNAGLMSEIDSTPKPLSRLEFSIKNDPRDFHIARRTEPRTVYDDVELFLIMMIYAHVNAFSGNIAPTSWYKVDAPSSLLLALECVRSFGDNYTGPFNYDEISGYLNLYEVEVSAKKISS